VDEALAAAEARRADAETEGLRVRLTKTRVRAPFAGRVAQVHVDPGTVVAPGTLLVEVIGDKKPIVRFSVAEGEVGVLTPGTIVDVFTAKGQVKARVVRTGAAVTASTRTLPVEAELEELAEHALPGMFVEVALSAEAPDDAPVVPLAALVGKGARRRAFVVDGEGVAHATDVIVLLHDGKSAAVRGLEPGQTIVTEGAGKARDGEKVEVVQ
jgi:membrane fusion protein (multidrug efflux system)